MLYSLNHPARCRRSMAIAEGTLALIVTLVTTVLAVNWLDAEQALASESEQWKQFHQGRGISLFAGYPFGSAPQAEPMPAPKF